MLVSEVMLQQTQVARVVPRYHRFLERFPTPAACAAAPVADVIAEWAGLGYNRRAVSLHRAAVAVVERHGGRLPRRPGRPRALPGVGPYTARAVLAFAFGDDVGVVEVNTARVLARAFAGRRLAPAEAQALADGLVPRGRGVGVEPGPARRRRHRLRQAGPGVRRLPAAPVVRVGGGGTARARPGRGLGRHRRRASRRSPAPTARAGAAWSTPSAGGRWPRPTSPPPPAGPTTRPGPPGGGRPGGRRPGRRPRGRAPPAVAPPANRLTRRPLRAVSVTSWRGRVDTRRHRASQPPST